ncbi:MAG: AraC family transcriptional regulator ligand-binding domain-containing protein [Cyclobacteriaceae bacterium]|nr:AraC family transcriptional regulator ligand-binding domain-containing protein [Cyclobacteriaceae bacterium]UYN87663.1 MAG: AraC family transcriptional regulator ligand-binding domain-containing protein [Cyclobacteriaceae bacterium]
MHAQMSIIRDIVYASVSHGANFSKFCADLGIAPEDLNNSEKLVDFEPAARVWDIALEQTGDPLLGLHIGEEISPGILGMTGYLMQNCRSLREAMLAFCKFNNVFSTIFEYRVHDEKNLTRIHFQPHEFWIKKYPESARQSVEISMSGLLRLFRLLVDKKVVPAKAELVYPKRSIEEYERILSCQIKFSSDKNALTFDENTVKLSVSRHDVSLFSFFNAALQQKLDEQTKLKGFAETLKTQILTKFKGQVPPIEIAASTLGLTTRSLQRKLKEENLNYRELGNHIKKELTGSILKNGNVKVKDIAVLLGYSDSSAFRKAFKKWNFDTR